jgi:hypothetical protein
VNGRNASKLVGCLVGKSAKLLSLRSDGELTVRLMNLLIPHCQEKLLARLWVPVPQTDTGRRGENPKVRGKTLVKELGKMSP